MLWTIAISLLLLWGIGLASATMLGGFIHVLLVLGLITLVARIIQRRKQA